jgi:hypothetical protein
MAYHVLARNREQNVNVDKNDVSHTSGLSCHARPSVAPQLAADGRWHPLQQCLKVISSTACIACPCNIIPN